MISDLTQFTLYVLILIVIVPMGMWPARTFTSPSHSTLERLTYKVLGIDPEEKMSWKRYGVVLLLSNAAMMGLGYLLLRIQNLLPFDPLSRSAQTPDLAFNTAASFVTNTNWQSYSGDSAGWARVRFIHALWVGDAFHPERDGAAARDEEPDFFIDNFLRLRWMRGGIVYGG